MKQKLILLLSLISFIFITSCNDHSSNQANRKIYKTTSADGYCYYDENTDLWYIWYLNNSGSYEYYGSSNIFLDYSSTSYSTSVPSEISESFNSNVFESDEMTESTGEFTGGSTGESTSDLGGMSESTGESTGGSDGGGE